MLGMMVKMHRVEILLIRIAIIAAILSKKVSHSKGHRKKEKN